MATTEITLTPDTWTQVYAGPTDSPIFVEKPVPVGSVWLAVGTDIPAFTQNGHYLINGHIKAVELEDGEILYAWCAPSACGSAPSKLIITD